MGTDIENSISELLLQLQKNIDSKNARLFLSTGKIKMQILNEFAFLFCSSFLQTIDDYNLSRNDIRIVLKIIEYMQFGNLLKLAYSSIAKDLNIDKGNVSKSIKKLKVCKLIIDIDGSLYLNPHIILKGKLNSFNEDDIKIINKSADALKGTKLKPSISTPYIKNKI